LLNQFSDMDDESDGEVEVDWEQITQSSVIIEEFEQPIELKLVTMKNITLAPRYDKSFRFLIIRVELMFGKLRFPEASWDVKLVASDAGNFTIFPDNQSLTTLEQELYYNSLPREAVWCFTVYGIKENTLRWYPCFYGTITK